MASTITDSWAAFGGALRRLRRAHGDAIAAYNNGDHRRCLNILSVVQHDCNIAEQQAEDIKLAIEALQEPGERTG